MALKEKEIKPHHIDIVGHEVHLTAHTKKGKSAQAVFDVTCLDKVKAHAHWRAVFSTEFNTFIIETKSFDGKHAKRLPLSAVILGCSPNAPIHHKDGDLLNCRLANLSQFKRNEQVNDFDIHAPYATILLKNRYGYVESKTVVDEKNVEKLVTLAHVWRQKKRPNGQPYVVDGEGRLLAHVILGVTEGNVLYKNKNPLDNRLENLLLD